MIAVLQRVAEARVRVEDEIVGAIGAGVLALVGVRTGDTPDDATLLARKIVELRVFEDAAGRMNHSLAELGLGLLIVSQFTLCADLMRGRRPGFEGAETPDRARALLECLVAAARGHGVAVAQGRFAAHMRVELVNEGPATFVLDTSLWRK